MLWCLTHGLELVCSCLGGHPLINGKSHNMGTCSRSLFVLLTYWPVRLCGRILQAGSLRKRGNEQVMILGNGLTRNGEIIISESRSIYLQLMMHHTFHSRDQKVVHRFFSWFTTDIAYIYNPSYWSRRTGASDDWFHSSRWNRMVEAPGAIILFLS